MNWLNQVICGDCLKVLKTLPDKSVNCCITSPPYWGLRDYGVDGQLGLEKTPEEYVAKLVEIFCEVRRVLRDDGTVWLNLGDSYFGSGKGLYGDGKSHGTEGGKQKTNAGSINVPRYTEIWTSDKSVDVYENIYKPKDLVGIPWRVAFALQADGWYLQGKKRIMMVVKIP